MTTTNPTLAHNAENPQTCEPATVAGATTAGFGSAAVWGEAVDDACIRQELLNRINDTCAVTGDLVIEELGLCEGRARVDVATIGSEIVGYEIKSDRDTLVRLPSQAETYSRVFDRVVVVTGTSHTGAIENNVPKWWGIVEAASKDGQVTLTLRRESRTNPAVDAFALAQLLWRDEALQLLAERGLDRGMRSKPRRHMWQALAAHLSVDELRKVVRVCLGRRVGWRKSIA